MMMMMMMMTVGQALRVVGEKGEGKGKGKAKGEGKGKGEGDGNGASNTVRQVAGANRQDEVAITLPEVTTTVASTFAVR